MIKRLPVLLFLALSAISNFGQINSESITLKKNEEVIEIINVGNNGFLIETVDASNYNYKLMHYSVNLEKLWDTPLNIINEKLTTSASPLSDYVYITNQTLQLNLKDKEVKKLEVKDVPKGRVLKSDFQDFRYWYIMYYIKFNSQYLVRRVEHKTCRMKELTIELPKPQDYKYSTEWYYLSNDNNNNIFVYDKTTGFQNQNRKLNNKINYRVITLDTTFKIKNKVIIDVDLGNNYVYPSLNFKKEREFPSPAVDFEIQTIGLKNLYIPKPEAYGSILYEPIGKNIYIYGLVGSTPYYEKDDKSVIEGYFIYKYDANGKLLNKIMSKLPNDTTLYGGWDVKTLLSFTPDNKMLFQIYFDRIIKKIRVQGNVYSYVYFEDKPFNQYINKVTSDLGKISDPFIYDYVIKNLQHFDFILFSSNFSGAVKYYNSLTAKQQKQAIFRLYRYNNGNLLIEDDSEIRKTINLMFFTK